MKDALYLYLAAGVSYSSLLHRMHGHAEMSEPLGVYVFAVGGWPAFALGEIIMTLAGK
jgi:hypothetical protein